MDANRGSSRWKVKMVQIVILVVTENPVADGKCDGSQEIFGEFHEDAEQACRHSRKPEGRP